MIHIIITIALLINHALSFDINSKSNVALYWGQNSAGSQQSLASYCQSTDADIYLLSFLNSFPNIGLNFANACTDTYADGMLHCSQIAQDIKTCQSLGKKVLLSLGGASGSYSLSDDQVATDFATNLWNTFGEGSDASIERPFDDAIIDGFDFDIENNLATGYVTLVSNLRTLFQQGSKQYYISAAPQCPYPDASVGDLLANADVDFAFIQFYNNYCNVDSQFNWDTWKNFAENVSPNKNIKLYLGLPASATAAGSGYISDLSELKSVIESISSFSNFGGVSLWDASQATSNIINGVDYVSNVKSILNSVTANTQTTTTSQYNLPSDLITNTGSSSISTRIVTTLSPTIASDLITATSFTTESASYPSTVRSTTILQPTANQESSFAAITSSVPVISTGLPEATTGVPETTTNVPETTANVPEITTNGPVPLPTTTAITTTTPATPEPTTTSSSANSNDSPAHTIAKQLNAQYAAGQFKGSATSCTDGDLACSADGQFAICNFGKWVTMPCAAGTTCFAYDSGNTVLTQCGFSYDKSSFI
ncbi:chitinase RNJ42_03203 [Nakaseomyces bracarensis]|uniref:chitinase n=1 Tax=Nakaseomyces bracarensis TaxID=273131 RepID=UPI0038722ABD